MKSNGNRKVRANLKRDYFFNSFNFLRLTTENANDNEYKRLKVVIQRKFFFHKECRVNIVKIN